MTEYEITRGEMSVFSRREAFIRLLERILAFGVKRVVFSEKTPPLKPASAPIQPRIDIVLSGHKHLRWPTRGTIADVLLEPGTMHYCPPLYPKWPLWDSIHEMAGIVFFNSFIRVTWIDHDHPCGDVEIVATHYYHTVRTPDEKLRRLCRLLDAFSGDYATGSAAALLLEALLKLVLYELEHDTPEKLGKQELSYLRAVSFLEENFMTAITRARTARKLQLNPEYLSQLFAKYSEETFSSMLRRLRLEYAACLLTETLENIDQIASECGYSSLTFFIAAFRKKYGIPPGKYRIQHRK